MIWVWYRSGNEIITIYDEFKYEWDYEEPTLAIKELYELYDCKESKMTYIDRKNKVIYYDKSLFTSK